MPTRSVLIPILKRNIMIMPNKRERERESLRDTGKCWDAICRSQANVSSAYGELTNGRYYSKVDYS